jgi:hypothetical protein
LERAGMSSDALEIVFFFNVQKIPKKLLISGTAQPLFNWFLFYEQKQPDESVNTDCIKTLG